MVLKVPGPAAFVQPRKVGAHRLGARENHEIGTAEIFGILHVAKVDLRVLAQRIEIRVVGDARQHRHEHPQGRRGRLARRHATDGILGIQMQARQIRQHAEHRPAGVRLEPLEPGLQQRLVAAEAVDHEADHACALRFAQ